MYGKRSAIKHEKRGEKANSLEGVIRACNPSGHGFETCDQGSRAPALTYNEMTLRLREKFDAELWRDKALIYARNHMIR